MFERLHHQRIAYLLQALDGAQLRQHHCYFGGGTAIVLRYGEYRESADVAFVVSEIQSYRMLRKSLGSSGGLGVLLKRDGVIEPVRDIRADQYGIRTRLAVIDTEIKFEIVFEARMDLDLPHARDEICGIPSLSLCDMAAGKLLANSARWADDGVFSRDLIDLSMLDLSPTVWREALEKAENAYGESIRRDLDKAIERIKSRSNWLERCMEALSMDLPKAVLWERFRALQRRLEGKYK